MLERLFWSDEKDEEIGKEEKFLSESIVQVDRTDVYLVMDSGARTNVLLPRSVERFYVRTDRIKRVVTAVNGSQSGALRN